MRYRRSITHGGTYFFTVNLLNRKHPLLVEQIELLRHVIRQVKLRHPFHIDAIVILPDHLHTIWTLPEGDSDYPKRWMLIKSGFSRGVGIKEPRNPSRIAKRERGIWQRRYWEHMIRDERDYAMHMDYIHYNPVKHGRVERASDWPYSSIHRYIQNGMLDQDWGVETSLDEGEFGE
ncbi:MAG: transposase [Sedimenticola sp.]|nr:transposase [Sedimenticola sp.]